MFFISTFLLMQSKPLLLHFYGGYLLAVVVEGEQVGSCSQGGAEVVVAF